MTSGKRSAVVGSPVPAVASCRPARPDRAVGKLAPTTVPLIQQAYGNRATTTAVLQRQTADPLPSVDGPAPPSMEMSTWRQMNRIAELVNCFVEGAASAIAEDYAMEQSFNFARTLAKRLGKGPKLAANLLLAGVVGAGIYLSIDNEKDIFTRTHGRPPTDQKDWAEVIGRGAGAIIGATEGLDGFTALLAAESPAPDSEEFVTAAEQAAAIHLGHGITLVILQTRRLIKSVQASGGYIAAGLTKVGARLEKLGFRPYLPVENPAGLPPPMLEQRLAAKAAAPHADLPAPVPQPVVPSTAVPEPAVPQPAIARPAAPAPVEAVTGQRTGDVPSVFDPGQLAGAVGGLGFRPAWDVTGDVFSGRRGFGSNHKVGQHRFTITTTGERGGVARVRVEVEFENLSRGMIDLSYDKFTGRLAVHGLDLTQLPQRGWVVPSTGASVLDYVLAMAVENTMTDDRLDQILLKNIRALPELMAMANGLAAGETPAVALWRTQLYQAFGRLVTAADRRMDPPQVQITRTTRYADLLRRAGHGERVNQLDPALARREVAAEFDVEIRVRPN